MQATAVTVPCNLPATSHLYTLHQNVRPQVFVCVKSKINRPTTPNEQNTQTYSLDIHIALSNLTVPPASIRKGPSSGTQIKVTPHETELATFVYGYRGVSPAVKILTFLCTVII